MKPVYITDPALHVYQREVSAVLENYAGHLGSVVILTKLLYEDGAHFVMIQLSDQEIKEAVALRLANDSLKDEERGTVVGELTKVMIKFRDQYQNIFSES